MCSIVKLTCTIISLLFLFVIAGLIVKIAFFYNDHGYNGDKAKFAYDAYEADVLAFDITFIVAGTVVVIVVIGLNMSVKYGPKLCKGKKKKKKKSKKGGSIKLKIMDGKKYKVLDTQDDIEAQQKNT